MRIRALISVCVITLLCSLPLVAQAPTSSPSAVQAQISRDQAVSSLPACMVLHPSKLFATGQCDGVWLWTMNQDDKVWFIHVVYNDTIGIIKQPVNVNFTLGQAIYRHSMAPGMRTARLKRYAAEEYKGFIDVANGIIYDIGQDIGTSMPSASVQVRKVLYLPSPAALVVLLKEVDHADSSPYPALTREQFLAMNASLREQMTPPPGPALK